ncbi:MAG: hypothetical protein JJE50_01655 [Actinomycetales bacterium]|nr:hypothetical protein [Actinomycetales bacterium]
MSELTSFVLARIAEDEARSSEWTYTQDLGIRTRVVTVHPGAPSSARVLAECEAKRRIVSTMESAINGGWQSQSREEIEFVATRVLRALASIWRDHSDFREEWRA